MMFGRDDLSGKLVHLTKGSRQEATSLFHAIWDSATLLGGTGRIEGGYRCVCFTEAPIAKLPHVLAQPSVFGFPYAPLGFMLDKKWLFERGGRPVIYQAADEYAKLPEELRWRHKEYDPGRDIDFTWEREWRIRRDSLTLDFRRTTLIVPNRAFVESLKDDYYRMSEELLRGALRYGSGTEASLTESLPKLDFHWLSLEDLGMALPPDW